MEHLIAGVRQAVRQENLYAALSLALTLPDICGKLRSPSSRSKARYVAWCDEYLAPTYTMPRAWVGEPDHCFLSGSDAYALRCAVLHESSDSMAGQRVADALDSFRFITPVPGAAVIHRIQAERLLLLDVGQFCEDVCEAVEHWLSSDAVTEEITMRMARLMLIHRVSGLRWSPSEPPL